MKKRLKALILTVILVVGILGVSIVAYASCNQHDWRLYRRYLAATTHDTCLTHDNCEVTVNHYEEDYRCAQCGEMKHETPAEIVSHSNP